MSVQIKTVEFERREAHLSSEDEAPWTVHGVALGSGDVTVGQSGIKKLWPDEELAIAAETLEGKKLVVDHENDSLGVVGEVTKAGYKDDVGVIYEAELFDEDLAEKISNNLLEVSIRGHHASVEQLEEDDETEAKIVEDITFENLSIVPTGAAKSNTIEMGEAEELSIAQLAQFTAELQEDEEEEIEAGTYVQWDDKQGIVLTMPEDGEVEVDVYEDDDGTFRPIGETEMVSVDSLDVWDVDEEDIGAMEDDENSDEEEDESEESDEEENESVDKYIFASEDEARSFIEDRDGLTGVHEMDDGWMPGADHDEFTEWFDGEKDSSSDEEMRFSSRHDALEKANELDLDDVHEFEDAWYPGESQEELNRVCDRVEGEEEEITSKKDKNDLKDQSPERYPEGGDEEELQEYSFHEPEWSGTTESDWSSPDLEDFDTDDLSEIADHFLISTDGFPPENYGDLKLPVVEPNGDLSRNALAAVKGGRGVSAVEGLNDDMEERIINWVNETANAEFDELWGEDEEEAGHGMRREEKRRRTIDDTGHEEDVRNTGPVGIALDMISKYLRIEGNHERDSVNDMLSWLFGSTDIPSETIADFRAAATTFINETGTDSFDVMTVEQFHDWLTLHEDRRSREDDRRRAGDGLSQNSTPVVVLTGDDLQQGSKSGESELDSLTTFKVRNMTEDIEEELNELDEPVAVEQSDLEELQEKANQFEEMNSSLEDLRERTEVLDEVDQEQVEELAESEEPVVIESARHEQLQDEAEQVKNVYAAALAEAYEIFDSEELTDRFSIEELRSKFEDNIGDPAEELAAEPRSGDPDEEELEEKAEQEESEQLSEEEEKAEEKRAELRDKILNGGR